MVHTDQYHDNIRMPGWKNINPGAVWSIILVFTRIVKERKSKHRALGDSISNWHRQAEINMRLWYEPTLNVPEQFNLQQWKKWSLPSNSQLYYSWLQEKKEHKYLKSRKNKNKKKTSWAQKLNFPSAIFLLIIYLALKCLIRLSIQWNSACRWYCS